MSFCLYRKNSARKNNEQARIDTHIDTYATPGNLYEENSELHTKERTNYAGAGSSSKEGIHAVPTNRQVPNNDVTYEEAHDRNANSNDGYSYGDDFMVDNDLYAAGDSDFEVKQTAAGLGAAGSGSQNVGPVLKEGSSGPYTFPVYATVDKGNANNGYEGDGVEMVDNILYAPSS